MTAVRVDARRVEFETLYGRHHREVWAVAYARRPDAEGAMELMQEAFLRLWRAWMAGEKIDSPRAWLLKVVRNLAEERARLCRREDSNFRSDYP